MAGVTMTKIRAFAAGVFALVLVLALAAVVTKMFGIRLPILGSITDQLGL
jgi:hypothetical protein